MTSKSGKRRKLFDLHEGKCFWCGCDTRFNGKRSGDFATVDHFFTRADKRRFMGVGFPRALKVLACYSCNHRRGGTSPEEFALIVVVASKRLGAIA